MSSRKTSRRIAGCDRDHLTIGLLIQRPRESTGSQLPKTFFCRDVLGHQFGQDFVLGLDLLLQELNPLLLLLDLTDGTFIRSKPEDLAQSDRLR